MSISGTNGAGKAESLVGLSGEFGRLVERAVDDGTSLGEFKRSLFDRLLEIGLATMQQFLVMQGDGDRGETAVDDDGRTLYRSEQPLTRRLRTIFGEHPFDADVDRRRRHPNTPITLRPVDERLGIAPDRCSPLLQEFTILLAVEQSFKPAVEAFEAIFRQRLSVDTLERGNRRMAMLAGVSSVDRYVRTPEKIVEALFRDEPDRPPRSTRAATGR